MINLIRRSFRNVPSIVTQS